MLNKIALKEGKIEGNNVKGTQKLYTLKNVLKKFKNRNILKGEAPKKELPDPKKMQKFKKEYLVDVDKLEEEKNTKIDEIYTKLSEEQKAQLEEMDVSDIQRLGLNMDYSMASRMKERYGKKEKVESEQPKIEEPEQ